MDWIFGTRKKVELSPGLVGLHITPKGISMAATTPEKIGGAAEMPRIQAQAYYATADNIPVLRKFVLDNNFEQATCNYVLQSQEYNLTLIDTPNVTPDEMSRALQWLVREFINFPVNEAVFDQFEIPVPRARDNMKMSYVSVMRKSLIPKVRDLLSQVGLHLKVIDIPELALSNIAALHPEGKKGTILVYLNPWGGKLIICRDGMVYIARSIELRLDVLINAEDSEEKKVVLEQLSLEIQRSLDYSNLTFKQQIANSILLAPTVLNQAVIKEFLHQTQGIEIHTLNLAELVSFETPISAEDQAHCLIAIGALLRERGDKT
jgi:MSHA biogenesis protein MshI